MKLRRITIFFSTTTLFLAATTPLAVATAGEKVGQGWIKDANDLVVTIFGLGLVVFFTLFVTVASLIQGKLNKSKKNRP